MLKFPAATVPDPKRPMHKLAAEAILDRFRCVLAEVDHDSDSVDGTFAALDERFDQVYEGSDKLKSGL